MMILRIKIALLLAACVLCAPLAFSADEIGTIDFLKGKVEITRDDEVIKSSSLSEGDAIENYDLIRTYANSEVTIVLTSPLSPDTVITIDPNTAFSVEIAKYAKKNTTTFEMFTGGIALKVQHLTTNQDMNVKSGTAVMGVRGTSFGVGASPEGDILVTCDEGDVEVTSEAGKKIHAVPGKVIEHSDSGEITEIPVAISSLAKFKQEWGAKKLEVFRANAPRAIKNFATRYNTLLSRFNAEFASLMKSNSVIDKWIRENKANKMGGNLEIIKEKKAVVKNLLAVQRTLFIFEKVYFRVSELYSYYQEGVGVNAAISPALSAKAFFAQFEKDQPVLEKKLSKVKFVLKLYAKRNDGSSIVDNDATGDFEEEPDDNFFGGE
jgi:hypothetical protein